MNFYSGFALFCLAASFPAHTHEIASKQKLKILNLSQSTPASLRPGALRSVVNQYKLWETGLTLNSCFFRGDKDSRQFVVDTVKAWIAGTHISFDFGTAPDFRSCNAASPSHVRVAFEDDGNWAYVGTDGMRVAGGFAVASVNLGDVAVTPFSLINKSSFRGTVLHEFGHVLALEHEHQGTANTCLDKVDWPVVYEEMGAPPNSWDQATVDSNLRTLTGSERLRTTEYDRTSIMHYAFPAKWFKANARDSCWVPRNETLSKTDTSEVAKAYPATVGEQAKYIAQLDGRTSRVVKSLNLSEATQSELQTEINKFLNDGLKRAGVVSNFSNVDNSIKIEVKADQKSDGPCSNNNVIIGGGNQVTSNCGATQPQVKP